jgi:hypothetical protein
MRVRRRPGHRSRGRGRYKYRKLVVDGGGRLAGAILIGHPALTSGVTGAAKAQRDVTAERASLTVGDWSAPESV